MISGDDYISLVKNYFGFLIKEFGYKEIKVTNRKNLFYDLEYQKKEVVISISYENREDYLQVILFKLKNGVMPDYDNKELTIHLEKLNNMILRFLSSEDFLENDRFFSSLTASNKIEKNLLKSAKELRLCLKNIDILEEKIL